MPTYCYMSDRTGQIIERVFPIGQAPRTLTIKGVAHARSLQAEHVGVPAKKGWPIECVASGVHADQAGELRKYLSDKGVPTEVTRDGNPVYRDQKHRKLALKARGLVDRSAYY